jgi:hypothetical protein
MKRKLIIGVGFFMMSEMGFSQSRNDFKGPAAKNNNRSLNLSDRKRKVAKVSNEMILNNERLGMVGPKAKNYKIESN